MAWNEVVVPLLADPGPNKPSFQRELVAPGFDAVVSPNVDTLYSTVVIDLSRHDLIITTPNVTDGRFWAYSFYDPYGNNFATRGSVTNGQPGKHLLQRRNRMVTEQPCEYQSIIHSPTSYVLLLTRIYVNENTTEDLNIVHGYQNQLTVSPQNRTTDSGCDTIAPALTAGLLNVNGTFATAAEQTLELTARLAPYNQPESEDERLRVASILRQSGLYNCHHHPQGVNLTLAASMAKQAIETASIDPNNRIELGNAWYGDALDIQANFGTNYAYRAFIASAIYIQVDSTEALYPRNKAFQGNFSLPSNQSLLFSFSGAPALKSSGFWSLTVYNEKYFLEANPLNVYSIGSRSDLTYEDGTHSFPMGNASSPVEEKPFQVLLQAADVPPPDNWTSNWLPTQAGGGVFHFNLRFYAPSEELTNGSYTYPVIRQIDAITA